MNSSKISAIAIATVLIAGLLATSNAYAYLLDVQVSSGTTDDGRKTVTLFFAEPPNGETAVNTDDIVDAVVDEAGQTDGVDDVNVTGPVVGEEPVVITDDQTNETSVIVPVTEGNVTVIGTNETTDDVVVVSNETEDVGSVIDVVVNGTIDENTTVETGVNGTDDIIPTTEVNDTGVNTTVTEEPQVNDTGIVCVAAPCDSGVSGNETTSDGGNVTVIGGEDGPFGPDNGTSTTEEPTEGSTDNSTGDNGTSTTGEIPVVVEDNGTSTDIEVGNVTAEGETSLSCVTGTFDLEEGPTGVVQCLAFNQ